MKAVVNQDLCIGCCLCAEECPDVFKMADDGKAIAFTAPVPVAFQASCQKAADECPVEAITIIT